ncbi:hypothetical protein FGO68_gene356 [Halteria grandinella]|uniref:Uncharacterized protein n=1 Tax=Halteria grandinella TaxID=5974 RepID=A0A8J8NYA8_HALGN|nr:hypothetical protein FGO68_gene356 [Halteria grandinella]
MTFLLLLVALVAPTALAQSASIANIDSCIWCVSNSYSWNSTGKLCQSSNTAGLLTTPLDCYNNQQLPKVVSSTTIDSSSKISPYYDIPLTWNTVPTSREMLITAENKLGKDVYVELRCVANSLIKAYAGLGKNSSTIKLANFGCGQSITLPNGQVGGVDLSLNSGAEAATLRVTTTTTTDTSSKAIAQMIGAAGFAIFAVITLSF